jgi:CheY-like chemotaxis protein
MQSVARDVSERKRLHATRAASERMMSLGRLAQGVGHEINNPLAYLTLSLELARSKLGPEAAHPDLDSALANAQDGVARITHIVKALVAFGRGDTEVVKPTRLQAVVEGALTLTANRLRHVARVVVDLDASLFVVANEFQLGQVFVNLLLNAADAMEEAPADRHVVRITSRVTAGGRVLVEVADSGPGIPAPALERVFDPFFTTKAVGRGTGIGLSISKAILATFDGTLEAANGERGGAVFRVGLAASEVAPKTPPVAREVPVPRLRVLVVDDEVTVGRLIHRTLTEHDVTVVTSAPAALSLCLREAFDVLLCDLMLPEMSGEALRRELLARAPALEPRMVFMTGGAFTDSTTDFLASVEERVLLKPFTAHALRAALAAAVARAPG